jgi:2-keto-3-deoxy-L-rhamnonate aldolase RhmA
MTCNPMRERFRQRETSYGLWVTLESPTITEIAAILGLGWVCIDMEHGHLAYREVLEHLRALRGLETTALVRVPEIDRSSIKRALDLGANGVLLPLVRGPEDVERGLRFGRYPPRGERGVGGERAVKWGLGLQEYLADADEETLIIPIIETREAAESIDSILAVPGLEAIFFGPADLSASHGYLGEWEGPGIAAKILEIREKAAARGIAAGVLSRSIPEAALRRDQGFGMVALGADTGLLIRAMTEALEKLQGPLTLRPGL